MTKETKKKFDTLTLNWLNSKKALYNDYDELNEFLQSLVGKKLTWNNVKYTINKIWFNDPCNLLGCVIELKMNNCSFIRKLFCVTNKFVYFEEFSENIANDIFIIDD